MLTRISHLLHMHQMGMTHTITVMAIPMDLQPRSLHTKHSRMGTRMAIAITCVVSSFTLWRYVILHGWHLFP